LGERLLEGLNALVQAQILNLLHELQRERPVSYLHNTHNTAQWNTSLAVSQRWNGGRIREQGAKAEVPQRLMRGYPRRLLGAVPRLAPA